MDVVVVALNLESLGRLSFKNIGQEYVRVLLAWDGHSMAEQELEALRKQSLARLQAKHVILGV